MMMLVWHRVKFGRWRPWEAARRPGKLWAASGKPLGLGLFGEPWEALGDTEHWGSFGGAPKMLAGGGLRGPWPLAWNALGGSGRAHGKPCEALGSLGKTCEAWNALWIAPGKA